MFIKEQDVLTKIGVVNNTPHSTLDINGNLNISPDNTTSGVNIGVDTENSTADYLFVNLYNNTNNNSIDFKSLGNYNIDLLNNFNIDINKNYITSIYDLNQNIINNYNLNISEN